MLIGILIFDVGGLVVALDASVRASRISLMLATLVALAAAY